MGMAYIQPGKEVTEKPITIPLGWQQFGTLDQLIAAYNKPRQVEVKPKHVMDKV